MQTVWFRARADLRDRWRAWVVMGLLVGLAGGAATAAMAGARRTESAYPRFLRAHAAADVLADVRTAEGVPVDLEQVLDIPEVEDAATALALFGSDLTTAQGRRLSFPDVFPITSRDGRFGRVVNRSKIVQGRYPDPGRIDEALVGFSVAERFDISVGEKLTLRLLEFDFQDFAPTGEIAATQALEVVGIGAMPGEFQALAGASIPSIHITQAFLERYQGNISPDEAFAIRFRSGIAGLEAFERAASERGFQVQAFFRQAVQTDSVRRSVRFQAVALWLLGGLTALAALVIFGQAIARGASLEASEYPALQALGMSRAQMVGVGLVRSAVIALTAAVLATVVVIATSPLTPVGLARIAEPQPGFAVDLLAVVIGAAAIVVLVAVVSALSQWRAARAAGGRVRTLRLAAARGSRAAELLARVGAPAPMVTGTRLALEPGRGRSAVPVRSTVLGIALGVLAVASSLSFGASMDHLVGTPSLAGWTFDLIAGGPGEAREAFRRALIEADLIEHSVAGAVPSLQVEGSSVLDAGLVIPPGPIAPAVAEGRVPRASDEAVLGRDTMREHGLAIGDEVRISALYVEGGAPPPKTYRVVGRLIQPAIGFNLGSSGQGAALTLAGFERLGISQEEDVAIFIRLRAGVDVRTVVEEIAPRFPSVFVSGRRESGAEADVSRLQGVPLLLAAILALMALATMTHTLVTSVRHRARDLAILRTVGFVGSQVRSAVAWQASVLVLIAVALGLPLGIVVARAGWVRFADALGVVPISIVPVLAVALVAPVVLLGGNLVAALPARAAARTSPAVVLRAAE